MRAGTCLLYTSNINVQVYSLVSEPISPIEKLKTIAKLGFAGAEFTADFTEVPVEEMKKVLAENNLKVDSAHVGLDQIEGVLPYFAELDAKLVICPATNFCNKAEAEEVAAELNRLGNIAKQYGIKIGYHNHTDEFYVDEGKYLYDWLIDACDPEVTAFQLEDVYKRQGWNLRFAFLYGSCTRLTLSTISCAAMYSLSTAAVSPIRPSTVECVPTHVLTLTS